MLEKAQLPPSIEHTYAVWLDKSGQPETKVVQPSPFKSQPVTQVTSTAVSQIAPALIQRQSPQRVAVPITLQTRPDGTCTATAALSDAM